MPLPDSSRHVVAFYRRAQIWAGLLLLGVVAVFFAVLLLGGPHDADLITGFLALGQDVPLLPLLLLVFVLRPTLRPPTGAAAPRLAGRADTLPVLIALALLAVCWAGRFVVFAGHDFVRDTQMADFDATIFAHGHLFWPIPAAWRPFAPALNLRFMQPIGDHEGWVSAYLPVNAAFRALVGLLADRALASPLFVAVGALALWRIARRLWPDSPAAVLVALALYAGSSQIVITGMTAFAMSGHLALDLLWLALFLRGGRAGHGGAMAVGFFATGLHQPLFHPLFALPFLDLLRQQRRFRLLAAWLGAYALIGAFWMAWPVWITAHGAVPVPTANDPAGIGFVARLLYALHPFDAKAAWLMAANLLRFAAWQHVLLLPLLALGIAASWRRDRLFRALAISLLLPVPVMALLLPAQGYGWGYRYLHGVLGNACLLGAYGWHWLEVRGHTLRRPGGRMRDRRGPGAALGHRPVRRLPCRHPARDVP